MNCLIIFICLTNQNYGTGYRFDEFTPEIGEEVHCFKTLKALTGFVEEQEDEDEDFEEVKFWKIHGDIIDD